MNTAPKRTPALLASTAIACAILTVTLGCATAPTAANFSVRTIAADPDADPESAVRNVLLRRDFVLVASESSGPRFVALPRTHRPRTDSSRTRIDIRFAEVGGARKIFCRAELQRQSTEARRIIALDTAMEDQPGATPLQREGASTVQQTTVWDTIGRDRALEREIIEELTAALGIPRTTAPN